MKEKAVVPIFIFYFIIASPSEKPSIIHLLDSINTLLYRTLETTSVHVSFTDESVSIAQSIAQSLAATDLDQETLKLVVLKEKERSEKNEKLYYQLVESLTSLLNSGKLHWRLYNLGFSMLSLQVILCSLISLTAFKFRSLLFFTNACIVQMKCACIKLLRIPD